MDPSQQQAWMEQLKQQQQQQQQQSQQQHMQMMYPFHIQMPYFYPPGTQQGIRPAVQPPFMMPPMNQLYHPMYVNFSNLSKQKEELVHYQPGDLVWSKIGKKPYNFLVFYFRWWPAIVCSVSEHQEITIKQFGTLFCYIVNGSLLLPYQSNYNDKSRKSKSKPFVEAIHHATSYIQTRQGMDLQPGPIKANLMHDSNISSGKRGRRVTMTNSASVRVMDEVDAVDGLVTMNLMTEEDHKQSGFKRLHTVNLKNKKKMERRLKVMRLLALSQPEL